jgi:hypothetical protein
MKANEIICESTELKVLEESFAKKAAGVVLALGLLGPAAAANAQSFDLGDIARALPMVVDTVNQVKGQGSDAAKKRIASQILYNQIAEEVSFDRWFAGQIPDPRDQQAFRRAAQEKNNLRVRLVRGGNSNDALKASVATTYYTSVRNHYAQQYNIPLTMPR